MTRVSLILNSLLTIYLFTLLFSDISLTGYFTDIVVCASLALIALGSIFFFKTGRSWIDTTLKILVCASAIQMGMLFGLKARNPLSADTYKMSTLTQMPVDNRSFNVYFRPGDGYGSGYGWLWITESPSNFSFVEKMKYYNPATDYDFGAHDLSDTSAQSLIVDIIHKEIIRDSTAVN